MHGMGVRALCEQPCKFKVIWKMQYKGVAREREEAENRCLAKQCIFSRENAYLWWEKLRTGNKDVRCKIC